MAITRGSLRASLGVLSLALCATPAFVALPSLARADCAAPPFEVLWTYPAANDREVPVDAVFWSLTTGWSLNAKVTLDGRQLAAEQTGTFAARRFSPGPLEPNHDYTLVFDVPDPAGAATASHLEIPFRTGQGSAAELPAPTVRSQATKVEGVSAAACPDVVAAQDCFDTGQNAHVRFELAPQADALAWLVTNEYAGASNLWPSECGAPTVRVGVPYPSRCFTLQALGAGGTLGEASEYCTPKDDGSGSTSGADPSGASDCSAQPGRARAFSTFWLVLALLAAARCLRAHAQSLSKGRARTTSSSCAKSSVSWLR